MAIADGLELRSSAALMPWSLGHAYIPRSATFTASERQAILTIYAGILATSSPEVVMGTCLKYGSFKYGNGKYCGPRVLREYRTVFRTTSINVQLDWNLQSPDGTIWTPSLGYADPYGNITPYCGWNLKSPNGTGWTPSIDKDGVLTFIDTPLPALLPDTEVPVVQDLNSSDVHVLSIANDGTLSFTSQAGAGETTTAGVSDNLGQVWTLWVNADDELVTLILPTFRPLELLFTPGVGTVTSTPYLLEVGQEKMWMPEIDNFGVLTFRDMGQDCSAKGIGLLGPDGNVYTFYMDRHGQIVFDLAIAYTELPKMSYMALDLSYTPTSLAKASAINDFLVSRVGIDVGPRNDGPGRFSARVNSSRSTRHSVDLEFEGGSDFRVSYMSARVNKYKKKPRG